MERILDCAKPIRATIRVSPYHVLQDNHVFDLLEHNDNEVRVQDDANGRTHLKGLSEVPYLLTFYKFMFLTLYYLRHKFL